MIFLHHNAKVFSISLSWHLLQRHGIEKKGVHSNSTASSAVPSCICWQTLRQPIAPRHPASSLREARGRTFSSFCILDNWAPTRTYVHSSPTPIDGGVVDHHYHSISNCTVRKSPCIAPLLVICLCVWCSSKIERVDWSECSAGHFHFLIR